AVLGTNLQVLSTRENYNNEIGVPQTLLQLNKQHQAVILEMGMRGKGQIGYLAHLAAPQIGVITNIGPQHIELLGSIENIAEAKAELLQSLPADGIAVLPADDVHLEKLKSLVPGRIVTFGLSERADYQVQETEFQADGSINCLLKFHDDRLLTF